MEPIKVLAATGMLGTGFSEDSFNRALAQKPDVIGCDAGSSDPGPYYLGSDTPMGSREATKRDLRIMIRGAIEHDIPMIIGSAGTAGSNKLVDWTTEIVREIKEEENLSFKMATIYSEVTTEKLLDFYKKGKISPLENAPNISEESIKNLTKVVGQMGAEPYVKALEKGAQIIIAGRSSDTSIYAAVPIQKGMNNGLVWHAAKILECGAGCVENRIHPDSMFAQIYEDHFIIEPPNPNMKCTPISVLSHFLYENTDPYNLYEPSGMIDTSKSKYEQNSERSVKVYDSKFVHSPKYTIRLEGTEDIGYRRVCIGGVRDPFVLKQLPSFIEEASEIVKKKASESLGVEENDFTLLFRIYGQTGVLSDLEPHKDSIGHEVGILFEVVAKSHDLCQSVMSIAWHTILHHPIKEWSGLVSQLAFPFSPPDMDMGRAYRFALNHIVEVDDPCELFEIKLFEE